MTDNPLWDMIQRYMDDPRHRYPPKPADLSRETSISSQVLSKWKARPTLPSPEQLKRLSTGTGISYPRLLEAALRGKGYFIAGPARVVTAEFLDDADRETLDHEDKALPFARSIDTLFEDKAAYDPDGPDGKS